MEEKIREIAKKMDESKYIPTTNTLLRASVSAIPIVGGSLDHVLFDKSDEIRMRNIEMAIASLEATYSHIDERLIKLDWFSKGESISLFKELISLIEYEDSPKKIKAISRLYAVSSTKHFADNNQKAWVMRKVSELNDQQRELFTFVSAIPPEKRKSHNGGLVAEDTAIWNDTVQKKLVEKFNLNPEFRFWNEGMNIDFEFELLTSAGLLIRHQSMVSQSRGYNISVFGKIVSRYLREAC